MTGMRSRRKFVLDCTTALAALATAPMGLALAERESAAAQSPVSLDYAAFAGQINTLFRVPLASGQVVDLRLIKAKLAPRRALPPSRRPPPDAENEKFSLIFSGPQTVPLASAIHPFEHRRLGRFEMHIGEIGRGKTTVFAMKRCLIAL